MTNRRRMHVRAHLLEGQGGLIRILSDVERFGLTVESIGLHALEDNAALLFFSATFLGTTGMLDATQLAARLARHSGVVMIECQGRQAGVQECVAA